MIDVKGYGFEVAARAPKVEEVVVMESDIYALINYAKDKANDVAPFNILSRFGTAVDIEDAYEFGLKFPFNKVILLKTGMHRSFVHHPNLRRPADDSQIGQMKEIARLLKAEPALFARMAVLRRSMTNEGNQVLA